jgi:hypothetical protein
MDSFSLTLTMIIIVLYRGANIIEMPPLLQNLL